MTTLAEQLSDFHQFATERLSSTSPPASLEDVIDEWYASRTAQEDLLAIEQSLDDLERGEIGRPVSEFLTEFRGRIGQGTR